MQRSNQKKAGSNKPLILILLAAVALILIIAVILASVITQKPAPTPPPIPVLQDDGGAISNISNGGTLLYRDGKTYLSDAAQGGQVFELAPGETAGTPLGEVHGAFLNKAGDKLYYVDAATKYLMRCALDGSEVETVLDRRVSQLSVVGHYLYYLDLDSDNALCRVPMDLSEAPMLLSDARLMFYSVMDGKIFYSDLNKGDACYCIVSDGEAPRQISLRLGDFFFVTGHRLYYADEERDGAITYIVVNGDAFSGPNPLDTGAVSCATADEENLYYVSARDGCLYRMKLEGEGGTTALTDFPVYGVQLAGDYLYYNSVVNAGAVGCLVVRAGDETNQ